MNIFKLMLFYHQLAIIIFRSFFFIDLNQQLKRGVGAALGGCGVTHWSLRTSSQWTVPEIAFQSGRALCWLWRHGVHLKMLQLLKFTIPLIFHPLALSRLLCHYKGANRSQNYRSKNTGLYILLCVCIVFLHLCEVTDSWSALLIFLS